MSNGPTATFEALAQEDPTAPAVSDASRSIDRATWNERATRLANGLEAELGLRPGDRVAIRLHNCVEWFEITFALGKLGVTHVPVGTQLAADEVRYILDDSESRALITDDPQLAAECAKGLSGTVIVGDSPNEGQLDFESLIDRASDEARKPVAAPSATLAYTSGTTGRPKGALRESKPENAAAVGAYMRNLTSVLNMGPGERHLIVAPLYHAAPPAYAQTALLLGGSVIIRDRFDAAATVEALRDDITSTFMVPTMIQRILALPAEARGTAGFPSLHAIIAGGAPFPRELREPATAYFGEVLYDFYGSTETGLATVLLPEDQVSRPDSVGRVLEGVDIRFYDEAGNQVPDGERGEMFIGSPMLVTGYRGNDEATAEATRDGFFSVGDVGYRDSEGFVYVVDRVKDMIISGGVNIYPAEIEVVLRSHPAVYDAAVVGVPHDDLGEEVTAIVELAPDQSATGDAIIGYCSDRLARNKIPRSVDFIDELPRNPSGKILKRDLRAPYWEGHDRSI